MAFFVSVFLNSSSTASMIGYFLSIWVSTFASSMNITIYSLPKLMPWYLYPLPTFPFCRVMYHLATECAYGVCTESWHKLPEEAKTCVYVIFLEAFIFLMLALYLQHVVPQSYGVPKHPLFFFKKCLNKNGYLYKVIFGAGETNIELSEKEREELDKEEDQDSKNERQTVYRLDHDNFYKYPLIVKDLRKVYPGYGERPPKVANSSICLKIKRGELFGLLGPNGAGKTTLISMLTGMFKPTSGNAWMSGNDIKN